MNANWLTGRHTLLGALLLLLWLLDNNNRLLLGTGRSTLGLAGRGASLEKKSKVNKDAFQINNKKIPYLLNTSRLAGWHALLSALLLLLLDHNYLNFSVLSKKLRAIPAVVARTEGYIVAYIEKHIAAAGAVERQ